MQSTFGVRNSYLILAGPVLSALSVYFVLSHLLFPFDVVGILSIISFALVLGLSTYLLVGKQNCKNECNHFTKERNDRTEKNNYNYSSGSNEKRNDKDQRIHISNLIFIAVFIISILIVGISKPPSITNELFISWEELFTSSTLVSQLVAAILISFFLPGYALVYLVSKKHPTGPLLKLLLSFFFSLFITGFAVYVAAIIIGVSEAEMRSIIVGVDLSILVLFVTLTIKKNTVRTIFDNPGSLVWEAGHELRKMVTMKNTATFTIFASLFALVIFYTCYIEKGVIVGDQWFHHGRALLIGSGSFRDFATSDAGQYYSPFFSAILAGFFNLSGVPSVNAYVSINFLNIMSVFAFYYFFSRWIPLNQKRSAMLATTLFVLSSGFGWVLVVNNSITGDHYYTQESTLQNLHTSSIISSDIRTPVTFINVGHPTFTSPLIIAALPAGFVSLGLIKEHTANKAKLKLICITTLITLLGILSHPEFYLFIIVASILILLFRFGFATFIYTSIFISLLFCIFVNFLSPQNYYTSIKIFNVPLLYLSLIFVSILWTFYETRIFYKLYGLISLKRSFRLSKIMNSAAKNAARLAIISVLAYMYLFSFIVMTTLSVSDIEMQVGTSTQRNIPWYLYPVKLGVVGLLGLTFILSCLFKKYERETLVFAVIAIIALFAGPYYDEHRFSKYVMVGMVGFASLLVYRLIMCIQQTARSTDRRGRATLLKLKPLVYSVLLGAVVASSSLSVFMLAGYKELGYKNFQFEEDFFRINFPSQSETNLLNYFRSDLSHLNANFIAIRANDSQSEKIFSELEGFSGIARHRILQNPQSLNASTLQGLYYSMDKDKIKYIILLRADTKKDIYLDEQFPRPLKFAINNFERAYQDDKYIVLKVPELSPPLSENDADVGLVYSKITDPLPPLKVANNTVDDDTSIFQYDYLLFNSLKNSSVLSDGPDGLNKNKSGEINTLTLYADKKPTTLWSDPIKGPEIVNYVESKFKLLAENKTKNDVGIRIQDITNNQQYHVSLDKDSIKLRQKLNLENISSKDQIVAQNTQIPAEQRGLWNTLKILVLNDSINVYLNDVLKIRETKSQITQNFKSISKIGISANENIVRFEPLKIGYLSESALRLYQASDNRESFYKYYYPISALALAKLRYDTFVDGDFSVFSKKNVMLTSDPEVGFVGDENSGAEEGRGEVNNVISEKKFNSYLEYANSGGTLIVMNTESNNSKNYKSESEQGAFGKFLSLQYRGKTSFDGITTYSQLKSLNMSDKNNFIKISGVTRNIVPGNNSDASIKSYYVDVTKNKDGNNLTRAPFAIEKKYGEGKIVFVNVAGYFDGLSEKNNNQFITLGDIANMIGIKTANYNDALSRDTSVFADARIKGDLKISDDTGVTVKSSAILLNSFNGKTTFHNLTVHSISTSPNMTVQCDANYFSTADQTYFGQKGSCNYDEVFKSTKIKDLELYGPYEVTINSADNLFSISPASSYNDYSMLVIPNEFDMSLNLSQGAYAEFTQISCKDNSHCDQRIRISNTGDLHFDKVKADSKLVSSISVLIKSPEIVVRNGTVKFNVNPNINNLAQPSGNIVAKGNIIAYFDHIESYISNSDNGIKTDYVTYLRTIDIDGNYTKEEKESSTLLLPGEISERAKDKGIEVPWQKVMLSLTSILIMVSIVVIVIAVKYYFVPKMRQYEY